MSENTLTDKSPTELERLAALAYDQTQLIEALTVKLAGVSHSTPNTGEAEKGGVPAPHISTLNAQLANNNSRLMDLIDNLAI